MTHIRPVESLIDTATRRKPGYLHGCLAVGKIHGMGDAQTVEFTHEQFCALRAQYALTDFKPYVIKHGPALNLSIKSTRLNMEDAP
jgi:hypothetical protein